MALAPFTRLTKFSQDGYESLTPSEICLVVHGIPSLREGSFACSVQSEDISLTPTGVKHLTDLRIRFRCVESQNQAEILQQLVKCIAGSSQLRRLELVATGRKPKVLGGDLVLNHILPVHGETLQKLKIPNLHPSNGVLKRTILRCKQLRALWLGISQNMKAQLPILLAASTSLEKIRIYAKGKWDLIYVEALFHQTCQSLSVFKVCATSGYQRRKSVWKSQWEYDSLLKQPVRKVLGPTAIQYP
ncbi:hypothetical protein M408DRAFT_332549 [Serendipita vermifera MAFF 305830]|uniref:F-box domain-containing protein n=1 Tax=Serendipita vermifera MAFF 305830 TaxID=933852 RepID=A0A0C3AEK3_SERVB|nr:hypothetical protein M408DRAFT_332549 [Serendipita vermifera MAFF 305830]